MPKRFVFEGNRRTQELNLGNSTNDSSQYIISVVEMRMREDGSFEEVKSLDSGQLGATGHIRVFPRYVVLGPNEAQTVKVQLVNRNKMAEGEFRSHIMIKAAPKKKPDYKKLEKMVTNLSVKLTPVFAITIPVIIRVGNYDARLNFSDVSFELLPPENTGKTGIPRLYGTLNRTGKMSVYGNLSIDHVNNEGLVTHVGIAKGIAVYAPNAKRQFVIDLADNLDVDYKKGKLQLSYTTKIEDRFVKMAEFELPLKQ